MKRLASFTILAALVAFEALAVFPVFAYSSNICTTADTCAASEVGVFMEGISLACGNTGDCTLNDIMLVFANTGNYVVGLIGGIVLLMYVVGGVYFLTSAGNPERVTKGKKYLSISTIGLLIVMFSYLGIYALRGALQYGAVAITDKGYVVCTGAATEGDPCELNSSCTADGLCVSECRQNYADESTAVDENTFTNSFHDCIDKDDYATNQSESTNGFWYGSCTANLCPGDDSVQCCQVYYHMQ